jgi:hypothetical protein
MSPHTMLYRDSSADDINADARELFCGMCETLGIGAQNEKWRYIMPARRRPDPTFGTSPLLSQTSVGR